MNIYVVTEGDTEKKVYNTWIPFVNSALSPVDRIESVANNNFVIISGGGYPYYFGVIESAIDDVMQFAAFDRIVICVDSEDMSKADKHAEIMQLVGQKTCRTPIRIVVQHFCFETWGLGNKKIIRTNPQSTRLIKFKAIYDARIDDPELLPENTDEELNRSQFAYQYLRAAFNDRYQQLTYSKRNPKVVNKVSYFEQVRDRMNKTGHIASFTDFLSAFV